MRAGGGVLAGQDPDTPGCGGRGAPGVARRGLPAAGAPPAKRAPESAWVGVSYRELLDPEALTHSGAKLVDARHRQGVPGGGPAVSRPLHRRCSATPCRCSPAPTPSRSIPRRALSGGGGAARLGGRSSGRGSTSSPPTARGARGSSSPATTRAPPTGAPTPCSGTRSPPRSPPAPRSRSRFSPTATTTPPPNCASTRCPTASGRGRSPRGAGRWTWTNSRRSSGRGGSSRARSSTPDGGLVLFASQAQQQSLGGEAVSLADLAVAYRAVAHAGDAEAFVSLDRERRPDAGHREFRRPARGHPHRQGGAGGGRALQDDLQRARPRHASPTSGRRRAAPSRAS